MNDQAIPTKELAAKLGTTQEAIRTLKTRNKERFTDEHLYQIDGCNFWTMAGQNLVSELIGKTDVYNCGQSNDTVASSNDTVTASTQKALQYLEHQIAEILADDIEAELEPKLDLDRINLRALGIVSRRMAEKLRSRALEHWHVSLETCVFSSDGIVTAALIGGATDA